MRYKTKQAKKQVDVEVLKTMYGNVIQNLEMTKFQRSQEEPIIEIIDEPILPLAKEEFDILYGSFIASMAAIFLCMFYIIIRKYLNSL
jgi:uncharacterized protein involved in exopolysaccharide biosynthesis